MSISVSNFVKVIGCVGAMQFIVGCKPEIYTPGDCNTSDHSKVGQVTVLSEKQHNVAGVATIVDDCTIEITNFSYDGGGLVVQARAAQEGDFKGEDSFVLSDNLLGTKFNGETLTLTLPVGKTLDDMNSVSIWCSAVGVSFGDGIFN